MTLAIIPARAGSKGLPGKNIMRLHGKPVIAYAVEAALASKNISQVVVSTDCQEIYQVGLEYGASDSFLRPAHLAGDTSLAIDAYLYTLGRLESEFNTSYESVAILQPTSPLRSVEDIDGAVELFSAREADSVISFCEQDHPIEWSCTLSDEKLVKKVFEGDARLKNRQEQQVTYIPNGAVYVFRTEILRNRKYYTDKSYGYVMPRSRSVDIDTIDDFMYAEFLMGRGSCGNN